MKNGIFFLCIMLFCGIRSVSGQEVNSEKDVRADSIADDLGTIPAFTIYKDNYIITGTDFSGGKINKYNSDAKFQISLRHRLYKRMLPWRVYLFFTYTQKSFWDIYRKSAPFKETNYNPTLGFGHNFIRNNRIAAMASLQYEHESNGRDSIWSRSWNKISFMGLYYFNRNNTLQAKFWIQVMVADENKYMPRYSGIAQVAGTYISDNQRFVCSVLMVKCGGWNLNANWQFELAYRMFRFDNQYFFLQYYNGYGESMIDSNHFHHWLRVGIVIKPNSFTIF